MQQTNELLNELNSANNKLQLDEHVKRILAQKSVLARILKATVREFNPFSEEEITTMIEPDIEISHTPIRPTCRLIPNPNGRIVGDNTEDKSPGEGMATYDIRFHIYIPHTYKKIPLKLLINIEAQMNFYQRYHFVTRGIFYGARMISSQLGTEFTNSHYNDIKKVYSIWICMNAPKKVGNAMAEFNIHKKNIIGKIHDGKSHYDKLSVIIICLNENTPFVKGGLHHFLNTLLSKNITLTDKQQHLEQEFNMKLEGSLRKEVSDMCNFGEAIEREGIRKGRRQGKLQGKRQGKREINHLIQYLIQDNRMDDLIKSTTDSEFQEKLLREYKIGTS